MKYLALLGGTFNPPHIGHINPALSAISSLGINKLGLMPCRLPPHKAGPDISDAHRVNMVELTCQTDDRLYPELVELTLPVPSYTVKTLRHLRQTNPDTAICFLIGSDSLYNLPSWYEWQSLLNYCHLVVLQRDADASAYSDILTPWLNAHQCANLAALSEKPSGNIWVTDTPRCPVSSTEIRAHLAHSGPDSEVSQWLAPQVVDYIKQNGLYA